MHKRTNKAYTITELLVAMAVLAGMLAASGMVFKHAVRAQQAAAATNEITQKFRAITDRLDEDLNGLAQDGEILFAWVPRYLPNQSQHNHGYTRFDRMVFFSRGGEFRPYQSLPDVYGTTARIVYMLANASSGADPCGLPPVERVLGRGQYILPADPSDPRWPAFPNPIIPNYNFAWVNSAEHESITVDLWKDIPDYDSNTFTFSGDKAHIYEVITNLDVDNDGTQIPGGLTVDWDDPGSYHLVLSEGVGEFIIQCWYDLEKRWYPEVDWDGDGQVSSGGIPDTDFELDPGDPTRIRQDRFPALFHMGNVGLDEATGLGKALKFTFTIYDSQGVFPEGKTFTHIVHLD